MQEQTEPLYDVRCQGELAPGFSRDQVRQQLAKVFTIDPEAVDVLLDQDVQFEKREVNTLTAKQYHHALTQAGLVAQISRVEAAQTSVVTCPKCQALSTNREQCSECGIYFHKWHDQDDKAPACPLPDVSEVQEVDPRQRKASRGMTYGTVMMVGVFFLDEELISVGLDMGWILYIIGTLIITHGAVYYALIKGYSGVFGLLGIGGLMGLGLLMLLPDRQQTASPGTRAKLLPLFLMLVGAYWWMLLFQTAAELGEFQTDVAALQPYHSAYPGTGKLSAEHFHAERQATEAFVKKTVEALDAEGYRPDDVRILAEALFAQIAAYMISINHHRYAHSSNQDEWPSYVSKTAYRGIVTALDRHIRKALALHNRAFNGIYEDWVQLYRGDELNHFHRDMNEVFNALREQITSENFKQRDRGGDGQVDTRTIDLAFFKGTFIQSAKWLDNSVILVQLKTSPLKAISGKTVILARGRIKFHQVGGTLSNKTINHATHSVFRPWYRVLGRI